MRQTSLFELQTEPTDVCPEWETASTVSQVRDSKEVRRLVFLSGRLQRAVEPVERAKLAAELRDLAEAQVEANVREANAAGATWREIGADLGIPFQTLYRRYGGG
jgi:hypothetical protein